MAYYILVLLDKKRMERIKGCSIEEMAKPMFGGELKCLEVQIPDKLTQKILKTFDTARIDSRGAITDLPVAFMREFFNQIVARKSIGPDVIEGVLAKADQIKVKAAKESEYLPPPEIDNKA